MVYKKRYSDTASLGRAIDFARGLMPAELLIKNAQILDVFAGRFFLSDIAIAEGRIVGIGSDYEAETVFDAEQAFVVPGFIDAHVHLESSLMTAARFQESVLPCGTTTVLWDPHEIANVKGKAGIEWALKSTENLMLDIFIMIPSCVPSTDPLLQLESSGAILNADDLKSFRQHPRVLGLAEMMNFPGLLHKSPEIMQKLLDFQELKRDGHCPSLTGKDLNAYAIAGICSCHESTTASEAAEKMSKGIHVLIREGSCAKDAEALMPVLSPFSSANIAFCSDDRNPLDIQEQGHINYIANLALRHGKSPEEVFRAASYGPSKIYGLEDRGAIAPGYLADLVVVRPKAKDWSEGFSVETVFKRGLKVDAQQLRSIPGLNLDSGKQNLCLPAPDLAHLKISHPANDGIAEVRVIGVIPGQILTKHFKLNIAVQKGELKHDLAKDILKIGVWERHHRSGHRSLGFVQGFGLKHAAIATSINHDSHNIIAVGSSDELMLKALQELIRIDGGIVVVTEDGRIESLQLPIGGLMTDARPETVAKKLHDLKKLSVESGCVLEEPFLQLSFLALPVIPSLKITDRGLVDVESFQKVDLICK